MPLCAIACIFISFLGFYTPKLLPTICIIFLPLYIFILFKWHSFIVPSFFILLLFISVSLSLFKIEKIAKLDETVIPSEITITEAPTRSNYGYSAIAKVGGKNIPKGTKILLYYNYSDIEAGDIFLADIKIHSFDKGNSYYYSENIFATASIENQTVITGRNRFYSTLAKVRNYITRSFYNNTTFNSATTLNAITVGERSGFDTDFSSAVRRSGLSHVMVVSGMHFAVIMNALFFIVGLVSGNKFIRAVIVLCSIFAFTALCGFSLSILRAAITYIFITFAPLLKRDNDPLNTLSLSAVIILLSSPFAALSVSFQLSMLSTLGILIFAPYVLNEYKYLLNGRFKCFNGIVSSLVITLSATILTLPIIIYNFGEVSIVAPLTNILVSFPVTATLLLSEAALILNLLPFISILARPLFFAADILTKYINYIIIKFGTAHGVSIEIDPAFSLLAALLPITLILCIYYRNLHNYKLALKLYKTKET